jgi:flagellar hook-associated protein 1 FlgK
MGNLFTSLLNSTSALRAYAGVFNTLQNNIANANTPGYARQEPTLIALPFDPAWGTSGGVLPGPLLSARSQFLERNVRNQQELLGSSGQKASDLAQVEALFDLTSESGVPTALNKFFGSFSNLAVNPNDVPARQGVIDQARLLASSVRRTAAGIDQVSANLDAQMRDAVAGINRLTAQIASINSRYRASSQASGDAGLDAQLHAALEELSGIATFTLIKTEDGAANIYLGGQAPLVIGDHQYSLQADFSAPQTAILDFQGSDVSGLITGGKLGALLEEKNTILPGYMGELNTFAGTLADTVNTAPAQGVDRNGLPPAVNLFAYNLPGDAASTLAVTGITPAEIAAALPTAPGGNGNAIAVAQLADLPQINGFTFTQFFGNLGARVGRDLSAAQQGREQFQDTLAYARSQRNQQTGVSLDQEAARLLQFQQAYQAAGRLVSVLSGLTESLMNIIR